MPNKRLTGRGATLVGAIICLMFGLELGGQTYAWDSPQILGLFGDSLLCLLCFYWQRPGA